MGKRKERRLAALSNAGRRVKLDLFAEPSGDLDGSDAHEEVGGDIDSRQRTKLTKSTSSSGPQAQNPLLLLEQYSDDEFEEDLNKNSGCDVEEALLADRDDEVTTAVEQCDDMDVNAGEDLTAQKVVQEETERGSVDFSENPESKGEVKTNGNDLGYLSKETDLVHATVPGTSNVQVIGDVSFGWKIVMHEESNNYYYWNIETGETSWEVPDVLAHATQSTTDIKTSLPQDPENVTVYKQESGLTTGGKLDAFSAESTGEGSVNINVVELLKYGPKSNDQIEGYKYGVPVYASQGSEVDQSYAALSTCSSDVNITKAGSEICVDYTVTNDELRSGSDLPLQLVNWSEILLERLQSLQKSGGYDWTSKYILETQIRLSDFKSLLSYKTSLLPFWEHSERKLKQIEDVINKEIYETAMSSQLDEAKATDISNIVRKDKFQERPNGESEIERVENNVSTLEHPHLPADSASLTLHQGDLGQVPPVVNAENVSSANAIKHLGIGTGEIEHVSQAAIDEEMASKNSTHSVEDVDMEVDMELEDANSAGNLTMAGTPDMSVAKSFTSLEQPLQPDPPFQPNLSSGYETLMPEDVTVAPPPPPDEEWIPPPPPDNEDVPPPPPDEPAEPLYPLPPSYTQLGQPLCYAESYQLSYPDSNIKYYGHAVPEVPSANFYGHSEACNVVLAQAPFYYEAVPNSHTDSVPVIVNAVAPEGYILQGAATLPVISTAESSQLHVDSSSMRFDAPVSIQFGSSGTANVSTATVTETDKLHGETTTISIQASASGSPKDNDVVPPSNFVTDAATGAITSAVSKVQSKALRGKKRTVAVAPSLRSNKKVSSLLDKWKAAKEELEDEEEPENAYEILERKREREIKEWHAQQIASGDAKENANFQPLGGDWRERVKRRRAQISSEVTQPPAEASTDGNQQPELAEISKDLPSGWQAYWDDSSKQVYYGNVVTSETSWTKPTK